MSADRPRPIRFVTDTNIAISALLWGGRPRELLWLSSDPAKLQLFSSPALLDELERVLAYPKLQPRIAFSITGVAAPDLKFKLLIQAEIEQQAVEAGFAAFLELIDDLLKTGSLRMT